MAPIHALTFAPQSAENHEREADNLDREPGRNKDIYSGARLQKLRKLTNRGRGIELPEIPKPGTGYESPA